MKTKVKVEEDMTEWEAFKPWDLFWASLRTIDLEAKCQSAIREPAL